MEFKNFQGFLKACYLYMGKINSRNGEWGLRHAADETWTKTLPKKKRKRNSGPRQEPWMPWPSRQDPVWASGPLHRAGPREWRPTAHWLQAQHTYRRQGSRQQDRHEAQWERGREREERQTEGQWLGECTWAHHHARSNNWEASPRLSYHRLVGADTLHIDRASTNIQ